jgi:dihydroorotase-like cyclic amidohydrolase
VLEALGMTRLAALSAITGTHVHFVHLSARESAETAAWMRSRPESRRVSWETQPHYALLTDDVVLERGALGKVGPPMRTETDRRAVVSAVNAGVVSILSSDHAPRTSAMKLETTDILDAPHGGISGVETLLTLAAQIVEGDDDEKIARLAQVTSQAAAARFGLAPEKGAIAVGADADFVFAHFDHERQIRVGDLHQRSDYSLYEGVSVRLRVDTVIKGGEIVVADGEIVTAGKGRHLRKDRVR